MKWLRKPKIDPDDGKPEVWWITVFAPNGRQLAEKVFSPPVRGIQAAIGQALAAAKAAEETGEDSHSFISL